MLFTICGGILAGVLGFLVGKIVRNAIEANKTKKGIINHIEKLKTEKESKDLES